MKLKALAVFFLFLVVLTLPVVPVGAADGAERYTEWYSDATKTDVVGWREEHCGGSVDSWGYQTAYKEIWIGNRCEEPGGGWDTIGCQVSQGTYCPAYCSYCIFV